MAGDSSVMVSELNSLEGYFCFMSLVSDGLPALPRRK